MLDGRRAGARLALLAYVFWHRAAPGAAGGYEARLLAFHAALHAHPPAGFRTSRAFRLDAAPWLAGDGTPYEDWYLVDSWAALGELNRAAVSDSRSGPHDAVARLAAAGAAGVYAPLHGEAVVAGEVAWLAKPPGLPYARFHAELSACAAAIWQRQMTLGAAGEYVVAAPAQALPWPAVRVRREQLG